MADRLKRELDPPVGRIASPVPQYWNPVTGSYEKAEGSDGSIYYKESRDLRGISTDAKPTAEKGSTFLEIDTGDLYGYNGSAWVLLLEGIWT